MRQFLKLITSSCLGTILAVLTLFLLISLISLSSTPDVSLSKGAILHLTLDNQVPELTDNVQTSPYSFDKDYAVGLNDLSRLLHSARTDDKIEGILIQTENTSMNPTKALNIGNAIREFKESGKFVYAYGDYYTQSGYIIASAADSIFLNPNGFIDMRGLGMVIPYMKDFSQKSQITFDVYYAGQYKSAIESYYLNSISDQNRYQTKEYLSDYISHIDEFIASNRDLQSGKVASYMNTFTSDNAETCLSTNLVDRITYWDEVEDRLKLVTDTKKLNLVDLEEYYNFSPKASMSADDRIAVVYAEGNIVQFGDSKGSISVERYDKALDKIIKNKKVKAVVLRINSPGGSAYASDVLWKKIEDLKKSGKTVVASFGDYAASGGYYLACGADYIVSEPTTLTGSIGVYAMMPNLGTFFKDKLGINWDTIGTGEHSFIYSMVTPKTKANNLKLQANTERTYNLFLDRVSQGRNISADSVNVIAQGRVWSGEDGMQVGLVDTIGSLSAAIEIAAEMANVDDYKTLQYPVIEKNIYEEFISTIMKEGNVKGAMDANSEHRLYSEFYKYMSPVIDAIETPQARLPFILTE